MLVGVGVLRRGRRRGGFPEIPYPLSFFLTDTGGVMEAIRSACLEAPKLNLLPRLKSVLQQMDVRSQYSADLVTKIKRIGRNPA